MRRLYKSVCACVYICIYANITESQNGWSWHGPLGPTGLTPQAGTSRAGSPGPCPGSFWTLPRKRLHSLSGHPVPVLSREVFPHTQTKSPVFQFVPNSFHPLSPFFPPSPSKCVHIHIHRHNFHTYLQIYYRSMHLCISILLSVATDMRLISRSAYPPVLFCVCGKHFCVSTESLLSYYAAVHTNVHEQQINISKQMTK